MSLSLNAHMNMVMKHGVDLLRSHQQQIIAECTEILQYLRETHKGSADAFEFAFNCFVAFFRSGQQSVETLIDDIRSQWVKEFRRPPEPHVLIFILTLIENSVHKAIKESTTRSFHLHPSVQYLFSKVCEEMLLISKQETFHMDSFCEQLTKSEQLRIEWIARVSHVDGGYRLKKVIGMEENAIDSGLFERVDPSWFWLSEALLKRTPRRKLDERRDVFPVPWKNETLIFCMSDQDVSATIPFLTYAMHLLQMEEERNGKVYAGDQWKDAVILFNEWIMRSQDLNEAIQNIAFGYAQYLPFERCALFRYSQSDAAGFGLFGYHFNNTAIRNIKETIDRFPSISKILLGKGQQVNMVQHFQPLYIPKASEEFPMQYVKEFELESVVVAPIYVPSEGVLIGGAILDQGPGKFFEVDSSTFTALLKFGQSAGELLAKFLKANQWDEKQPELVQLSAREIHILQLLADGASTTEAAEMLHLSEYTVRDYVSSLMKRLHARNRTEAAVKAMRLGLIH
ncbi:response regulator transcription factor [Heyndrickxia coagulans]|uniref:HTH luxR-type domain-containing protein n=1 Tax=Heyndrickxia coagulans TaxID=1398 RepID=A0A150KDX5_HEYCO|nr:response regulator transcription factor [Heyndrickxia coagulans]KYC67628.1 hypothetical protein B4099_2118 [Heyndrickxia coagulans]